MFYLFWTILNTGLILLFIFVCFNATKLVKEKLGLLAAIFFVFGLFSFISRPKEQTESESDKHKWSWQSQKKDDSLVYRSKKMEKVVLEKNIMFSIDLRIGYYINESTKEVVPFTAFSTANGIFGSYKWKPSGIFIHIAENGKDLEFDVSGTIESNLLGATVHHNYKNYTGVIKAK